MQGWSGLCVACLYSVSSVGEFLMKGKCMLLDILNPQLACRYDEVLKFECDVLDPDTHDVMYSKGEVLDMKKIFVMFRKNLTTFGSCLGSHFELYARLSGDMFYLGWTPQ